MFPTGIAGQWYLKITLKGVLLPANPTTVPTINVISNMHQHLPVLNFTFKDNVGLIKKMNVVDGDTVSVDIGIPGIFIYENLPFRIQGSPKGIPTDSSISYSFKAFLDNLSYVRKIQDEAFKGTSTGLAEKIASKAGLKFNGDAASDSMTWLPNRMPLSSFLQMMGQKAWASNKSGFIIGVDDTQTLHFKDLNKLAAASATKTFSSNPEEGIAIRHWKYDPKDGVYNHLKGYGSTSVGMKEDGTVEELNKIAMRSFGGGVGGDFVKGLLGDIGGRVQHLGIQSGNVHNNWNKAIHQNSRLKSLFACDLVILTDYPTQVKLFDKVKAIPYDPASYEVVDQLVGDYIVTSYTKTIVKQQYYEKLTLTTNSGG